MRPAAKRDEHSPESVKSIPGVERAQRVVWRGVPWVQTRRSAEKAAWPAALRLTVSILTSAASGTRSSRGHNGKPAALLKKRMRESSTAHQNETDKSLPRGSAPIPISCGIAAR